MADLKRIGTMAPTANGVEIVPQRAPQSSGPGSAVRALSPITEGPAALRNAMLEMCLALAAGWGIEKWTPEKCKAQVAAGPLGLIQAHDMQVRRK